VVFCTMQSASREKGEGNRLTMIKVSSTKMVSQSRRAKACASVYISYRFAMNF